MKAKSIAQFSGIMFWAGLVLIAFVLSVGVAVAGPHPNMYLNQAEIDAIKEKVVTEEEPWASAHSKVMDAANAALTQSPLSVTYEGRTSRQYYTENPRCGWVEVDGNLPDCRVGALNSAQDRGDYLSAIALGNAVRDLGLGYVFTGEAKYANKAIELIRVWSVDPETRMAADDTAMRIELFITLPGYFYGADLIWNYDGEGGWVGSEKESFRAWVKKIADLTRTQQISAIISSNGTSTNVNNFANWRNVLIASAGSLLDDQGLLDYVESAWKYLVSVQMTRASSDRPGLMIQEVERSQGLDYSLYAINAMIQGAEIMRHHGVNLYDYEAAGERSLKLALSFMAPFAIDPESWVEPPYNYEQSVLISQDDNMALFELAYSYYQDPIYLEAINRWGRPMDEIRVMGINTLTHGNMFSLNFTPTPPSLVTQPDAITVTEGADATFSVVATGSATLVYQWFRDNTEIPGATSASYTVIAASSSDSGTYHCYITNDQGSISSDGAVLAVSPDTTAPTLLSAVAASDTRVDIRFSEPVSASSAESSGNYQIDLGIAVTGASLSGDGRTVSLTVSQLATDTSYNVSVSNVPDRAATPNTIDAQSSVNFTYRSADGFDDGNADGWVPLTESRWEVVLDGGNYVYWLNTSGFDSLPTGRLGEYSLLPGSYGDFTFTAQAKLGDDVSDNALADYAVVFGFEDEKNYYYMMFNNQKNATQLFKVESGSRTTLATANINGPSDDAYHRIEVSRAGSAISVYFDGSLMLSANDNRRGVGQVGVGSYNDAAYFDDVSVGGVASITPATPPPVITLIGPASQELTVGDPYRDLGASANNNQGDDISGNILHDYSAVDTATVGIYVVTYNVMDAEGNTATEVVRTVNVVAVTVVDTTPPVITLIGPGSQTIPVGTSYSDLGATASDNIDIDDGITARIQADYSAVDTSTAGSYVVTYNVMDAAGNAAAEMIRTVTVVAAVANSAADNSGSSRAAADNSGGGVFGLLSGSLLFMLLVFRFRRYSKKPGRASVTPVNLFDIKPEIWGRHENQ
ncbi:MAG: alginate lyase family protein [Gammaproteobacteria bacterium]|nr:alginate lyase family protein [Gammaproteobacteria bacterium]